MLNYIIKCLIALILATPTLGAFGPQVFWASDPVQPGESVLMVGAGFGNLPRIEVMRLNDDLKRMVEPDNWSGVPVESLQPSDQSVKFVGCVGFNRVRHHRYAVRSA